MRAVKHDKSIRLSSERAKAASQLAKDAKKKGIRMSMNAIVNMAVGHGLPSVRKQLVGD